MSDPYTYMAQWMDMAARAESMLRHPSGQKRGKDFSGVDWKAMYEQARRERDETDFDLFTVRDQLKQCRGEREQMTRDRDEWKARAEKAEARTAPAVTRTDVEKAIRGVWADFIMAHTSATVDDVTDAVCRLFGIEAAVDPVVYVVRESAIAAVEVKRNEERDWFTRNRGYAEGATADGMRNMARIFMEDAVDCEAIARAIDAEAAVDPVEQKARELYEVVRAPEWRDWDQLNDADHDEYYRLARHVLGNEVSNVDQ